jgi:hypothetical protein
MHIISIYFSKLFENVRQQICLKTLIYMYILYIRAQTRTYCIVHYTVFILYVV